MFGSNNNNPAVPLLLDNKHYLCSAEAENLQQLHGNLPIDFHVNSVNFLRDKHVRGLPPSERGRDIEAMSRKQQNLRNCLNNIRHDEAEGLPTIMNQNPVSTGLRLSYDEDEHNSSISSASGYMMASSSVEIKNDIRREFEQQNEELEKYIRIQEENIAKGLREIRQRHTAFLLTDLENWIGKRLHEKDVEFKSITCKNKELVENMKQVTAEAQNWCYLAKYNESVCDILRTNLQQAMQGSNQVKEGFGENNVDDAASYLDPNNYPNNYPSVPGGLRNPKLVNRNLICKLCQSKEVSILLMPCRHLCLCKDCEGSVHVCPVCRLMTTARFEVYLS